MFYAAFISAKCALYFSFVKMKQYESYFVCRFVSAVDQNYYQLNKIDSKCSEVSKKNQSANFLDKEKTLAPSNQSSLNQQNHVCNQFNQDCQENSLDNKII
ncbi:hypothetical protein ABPG73_011058 [Tetrahymena malaccensis]